MISYLFLAHSRSSVVMLWHARPDIIQPAEVMLAGTLLHQWMVALLMSRKTTNQQESNVKILGCHCQWGNVAARGPVITEVEQRATEKCSESFKFIIRLVACRREIDASA